MSTEVVTPPAAPATPPPAAPVVAPAAPATPIQWTQGFNEDLKGYVATKGFQGPDAVVDAYRNLEKMVGAPPERIIKMAEKIRDDAGNLTPEAKQIFERLGAPKEAKDYQLEIPKEFGDEKLTEQFKNLFHQEGVNKASAEKIVKTWNEYQANIAKLNKEAFEANFKNQDQSLRKDWGQAYEQNVNIAKEAVRTVGIDAKSIDALAAQIGHDKTMQLFHKLGAAVGEGKFIKGDSPNRIMEPSSAQYQIKELMKDRDFATRLDKGDMEARQRWDRLHQMAYPEAVV